MRSSRDRAQDSSYVGRVQTAAAAMPGKRTLVDALPATTAASPAIQRNPAAIPPTPDKPADKLPAPPDPVYQYGSGTLHGNDCGPAAVLAVLRQLDYVYKTHHEDDLRDWIASHRPIDPATHKVNDQYRLHYAYADATAPAGAQEELDVVRLCTRSATVAQLTALPMPDERGPNGKYPDDQMLSITDLQPTILNLIRLVGGNPDDPAVGTALQLGTASPDFKADGGRALGRSNIDAKLQAGVTNRDTVTSFLVNHVTAGEAVIVLGSPFGTDKNGQPKEDAWHWGGDHPSDGGHAAADLGGGHFVVVTEYDGKQFTVLDSSWATQKFASADDIIEFLDFKGGSYNVMTVKLDQLHQMLSPPTNA